jgi:hypothetical protein
MITYKHHCKRLNMTNKSKIDSIDLSSVNKNTKTRKLNYTKIEGIFKRRSGPNRDSGGRFTAKSTTGSGGLRAVSEHINLKHALPVMLVVTLVGGYSVFNSFAANTKGAFVTEMYQRCYNQMKTSGEGYNYWLSRLNNGESENAVWAAFVAASGKPCNYPYPPTSTNSNTATNTTGSTDSQASMTASQVIALYKEILGRTPNQKEIDYWVNRSETVSSAKIRAEIEDSDEAFKKSIQKKITELKSWETLSKAYLDDANLKQKETSRIANLDLIDEKEFVFIVNTHTHFYNAWYQLADADKNYFDNYYNRASRLKMPEVNNIVEILNRFRANNDKLVVVIDKILADYNKAAPKYEAGKTWFETAEALVNGEKSCLNKKQRGWVWNPFTGKCIKQTTPSPQNTSNGTNQTQTSPVATIAQNSEPKFMKPTNGACYTPYASVSGRVLLKYKWFENNKWKWYTSRIDAMSCYTDEPGYPVWNTEFSYNTCSSPYKSVIVRKTFSESALNIYPTIGIVCFRGPSTNILTNF